MGRKNLNNRIQFKMGSGTTMRIIAVPDFTNNCIINWTIEGMKWWSNSYLNLHFLIKILMLTHNIRFKEGYRSTLKQTNCQFAFGILLYAALAWKTKLVRTRNSAARVHIVLPLYLYYGYRQWRDVGIRIGIHQYMLVFKKLL